MNTALLVVVVAAGVGADFGQPIELGGLRQASARVGFEGQDYRIDVRMKAVTDFDEATNGELNRAIARADALQALGRYLSRNRAVRYTTSGARVRDSRQQRDSFELTLLVPVRRVRVEAESGAPRPDEPEAECVVADGSHFARKAEYEQTIGHLERALDRELERLVSKREEDARSIDRPAFESLRQKIDTFTELLGKQILADVKPTTVAVSTDEKRDQDQLRDRLAQAREYLGRRADRSIKKLFGPAER